MDIKQLRNLLKVLRQNGVTSYKTQELELTLAPESLLLSDSKDKHPASSSLKEEVLDDVDPYKDFPTGILSPEELMFWSSGGDLKELEETNEDH